MVRRWLNVATRATEQWRLGNMGCTVNKGVVHASRQDAACLHCCTSLLYVAEECQFSQNERLITDSRNTQVLTQWLLDFSFRCYSHLTGSGIYSPGIFNYRHSLYNSFRLPFVLVYLFPFFSFLLMLTSEESIVLCITLQGIFG